MDHLSAAEVLPFASGTLLRIKWRDELTGMPMDNASWGSSGAVAEPDLRRLKSILKQGGSSLPPYIPAVYIPHGTTGILTLKETFIADYELWQKVLWGERIVWVQYNMLTAMTNHHNPI